uniref:Odorant receptor n=1 Tax=Microplitis mediator TaxID=375433 RepID=A0A0H4KCQ8_9HYME|nr:odorant receptor 22 [Microplitis mediator]
MDNSLDSFLRINRLFLSSLGQWPQQEQISKIFTLINAVFFLITQAYFQTGGMIAAKCDQPIFMESIAPVLISFMCLVKFVNFNYNADKMRKLLEIIQADWNSINDLEELKILNSWAKDSRKNTIMYAGALYGTMAPFMLGPLVPIFCKLMPAGVLPANSSIVLEKPVLFHVEYFYDLEKYYYPLLIHSYFGTMAYMTVAVAIDSMFMVYVQHACAIFAVIGNRLEHLADDSSINFYYNPHILNDEPYKRMIECIVQHSKALQYAQMIQSANSLSFFFNWDSICSLLLSVDFNWPSQRLADESARISETTTRCAWYLTSMRSRKLLQLFIMRSSVPCQLTAGSFYTLNMQNFSAVVRTSMSYFTVLTSVQ